MYLFCDKCQVAWLYHEDNCWLCGGEGRGKAPTWNKDNTQHVRWGELTEEPFSLGLVHA